MTVQASVRYLAPEWREREERPHISSRETRRAHTRFYEVSIEDARPLAERGELDLDTNGFVLVGQAAPVEDFENPAGIERTYYPRMRQLVKRLTGASDVFVLHHLTRSENPATFANAYARYVHCDFGDSTVRRMSERLLIENGAKRESDVYDHAWLNTWQPVDRAVQSNPLTVIDARSVSNDDLRDYTFSAGDYGVGSMPLYSEKHRHFYFPEMQTDEILVFKQYDSRSGRAKACPHTSFDDATSPEGGLPRRSIELRLMALFPRS